MADLTDIADSLEGDLRRAFLEAVTATQNFVDLPLLIEALKVGSIDDVMAELVVGVGAEIAVKPFIDVLKQVALAAAQRTVGTVVGATLFNLILPQVAEAIAARSYDLWRNVKSENHKAIRAVIMSGQTEAVEVPAQARLIRGLIGLRPDHVIAWSNFNDKVTLEHDPVTAERLSATYQRRLLAWRADSIARTENIHAAYAGQYAAWNQMVDTGIIQPNRTWLRWDVADDDRLCQFCAPMDGMTVPFGAMFSSTQQGYLDGLPRGDARKTLRPDPNSQSRDALGRYISDVAFAKASPLKRRKHPTKVLHPPLHPQCRCTVSLVFGP